MSTPARICAILLACVLLMAAGCATSSPSRFYTLNPTADAAPNDIYPSPDLIIGVGPVEIPEYLDSPRIVTRSGGNELTLAEYDRWAGSLREDIGFVMGENLSKLLGTDRVMKFPWSRSLDVDYQISMLVVRMEGTLGGQATLNAQWTIQDGRTKEVLAMQKVAIAEPTDNGDYEGLIAAQSRALGLACQQIASQLNTLRHP